MRAASVPRAPRAGSAARPTRPSTAGAAGGSGEGMGRNAEDLQDGSGCGDTPAAPSQRPSASADPAGRRSGAAGSVSPAPGTKAPCPRRRTRLSTGAVTGGHTRVPPGTPLVQGPPAAARERCLPTPRNSSFPQLTPTFLLLLSQDSSRWFSSKLRGGKRTQGSVRSAQKQFSTSLGCA